MMDAAYMADPALWLQDLGLITDQDGNPVQLDPAQREVLRSPYRRVLINCHRQLGKSTICSAICFHRALYYPRSLCLLIAPSLRQSGEDFRKVLDCLDTVTFSTTNRLALVLDARHLARSRANARISHKPKH